MKGVLHARRRCLGDVAALKRRLAAKSSLYFQARREAVQDLESQLAEDGASSSTSDKRLAAAADTVVIADSICRIAAEAKAEVAAQGEVADIEKEVADLEDGRV